MSFKPLQFNQSYNNFNNLSKFVGFFLLLSFFIFIISCDSDILINDQKNNNTQLSIIGEDTEIISKFPNYLVTIINKKIPGASENPKHTIGLCMGAVIAPNVVITAAHCSNEPVKVGLPKDLFLNGLKQFNDMAKGVKKVIRHEELDMAVLLLSDQDYNSLNLQPVLISDEPIFEVTDAHAYGHGGSFETTGLRIFKKSLLKLYPLNKWTDLFDRGGKYRIFVSSSLEPKQSGLLLKDRKMYEDNSLDESAFRLIFTAESQSNLKNKICSGDSGGPIIKKSQNQPDEILALFHAVYIVKGGDSSEDNYQFSLEKRLGCSELGEAISIARNKKWIDESIKKLTN